MRPCGINRKHQKVKKQKKRARIVIRNLSFQATHDDLKEYFSKYGNIEEIKILTRDDGKRVGCAFVQFDLVQNAAQAIRYSNMQTFLNRAIVVDWAVPKREFLKNNGKIPQKTDEDKAGDRNSDSDSTKEEVITDDIKVEDDADEEKKEIELKLESSEDESVSDSNNNEDNDNGSVTSDFIKEEKGENNEEKNRLKHLQRASDDVNEGKTVFLKNVPFSVKNDELKEYMEQFGPVHYALVCIDRLTEHSRGTAFVKFKNIASAEECLSNSTKICMHDQVIEAQRALRRNEVENKKCLSQEKVKDSRNLYLVKEGVVLAGSPAATEVSVADIAKRLKLEQWKSQMLRNLNMFVSRVRLVVHNLPPNLDDTKLRLLFKNHSSSKAIIKEARVMRDLKNVDASGKGKSKEYGFVTFTTHQDALNALRSLNNNPNIFSKNRRPIIGFSIENRIMVNAKERRIQKSREHNLSNFKHREKRKATEEEEQLPNKSVKARKLNNLNEKPYAGIIGKLGQSKLRSNFSLRTQAELHARVTKKERKLNRTIKQTDVTRREKAKKKQGNVPVKTHEADDASFNKLVNGYKNKLKGIDLKKSKWYEGSSSKL